MSLKIGDKVVVIAGKDKGKTGKIIKILKVKNRVLIEGINIIKKHQKPDAQNENGGIIEIEAPIHMSNVMIADANGKGIRVGHAIDKSGKKHRVASKSKEKLD